jgi:predicted ATPase
VWWNYPLSIKSIEEPESNLHPALQSKLADMFIDAARTFNTQFIIETHSEYLIRKLQYFTAKGEIKTEDTAIYYFYPPDDVPPGEEQVKRIDIQEDGSLTDDFGTGFFDEADKIAMSIWNMNKSQKN